MGLGLSASTIKSWFQYRCRRKTRYELMDPVDRAAIPLIQDDREKPWADFGVDFERRVLAKLAQRVRVLVPNSGEDGLSERLATSFFRGEKDAKFASQLNLKPKHRPPLLDKLPNVRIRRTYSDLVRYDLSGSAPSFRVIDIKATRVATAFHKTQVAFYARMLESVLKELGVVHTLDAMGSIWRIPDGGTAEDALWYEEDFTLAPYLRLVDDFCENTLPSIAADRVEAGVDETFFHIYFKCEQCAYLPHCSRTIDPALPPSQRDLSATPGLTHEAKRILRDFGIANVEQLSRATGLRRMEGVGWSLAHRAETLVARAEALRRDQVLRAPEAQTFLMPPRADVAFYLLADHDPVDNTLVTLGYIKVENEQVSENIELLPTSDKRAEADALVNIFSKLVAELERIDRVNEGLKDDGGLYSHIFFYEPSEALNLQSAVQRHLDDPRVRNGLLHMVRLFPPEDLVPEPEFRGIHHLPATALRSVVEQLYALPVSVSYDLRQVSNALRRSGHIPVAYSPDAPFRREFSSLLSIEVIRGLRENKRGRATIDAVRGDVRARLDMSRAIADWLWSENKKAVQASGHPMLRLAKKPFRLHASFDPLNIGDLDVLMALELLENRAGLLDTLVRLAQPVEARRDARRCAAGMRLINHRREGRDYSLLFDVPIESRDAEMGPDTFGLILSDDNPDLRLNPSLWSQVNCRISPVRANDRSNQLRTRMHPSAYESATFQDLMRRTPDRGWCLDQTFVDINLVKSEGFLSYLSEGDTCAGS
jgi:hypothetical protein